MLVLYILGWSPRLLRRIWIAANSDLYGERTHNGWRAQWHIFLLHTKRFYVCIPIVCVFEESSQQYDVCRMWLDFNGHWTQCALHPLMMARIVFFSRVRHKSTQRRAQNVSIHRTAIDIPAVLDVWLSLNAVAARFSILNLIRRVLLILLSNRHDFASFALNINAFMQSPVERSSHGLHSNLHLHSERSACLCVATVTRFEVDNFDYVLISFIKCARVCFFIITTHFMVSYTFCNWEMDNWTCIYPDECRYAM